MPYKTILLHCNDAARMAAPLRAAAGLAARFQAHLIGLSVVPPVIVMPAGMPGTPDTMVVDSHCEAYRRESPRLKAAFEADTRTDLFVSEWREAEAGSASVAATAMQYARAADLVVAPQRDPKWPGTTHLDIADRLAVESGRPVLIVPGSTGKESLGENVLVAWNGRREAARAAFDALPILRQAKVVKVIRVNAEGEGDAARTTPVTEVCAALARHGVKCEAMEAAADHSHVGHTLLARAEDEGCDLLVMGCYGHSRLREFVLGGASRHVLAHMTMPVLMSH